MPPNNLMDEDFDEDTEEPPPGDQNRTTLMTYPLFMASICKLFGLVVRQAHALAAPTYAEVMKHDSQLEQGFAAIPGILRIKILETCLTDPPPLMIPRLSIASLYQKARCVLHRRYLVEKEPQKEHEYSRQTCLQAALTLLEHQSRIFEAAKPGGMLSPIGYFALSLGIHNFLLGAVISHLVIQND